MKALERLLELWEQMPLPVRTLLVDLAEALVDRPANRPTVVMKTPPRPKGHHCPDCRSLIPGAEWKYCVECGCMLPDWIWP